MSKDDQSFFSALFHAFWKILISPWIFLKTLFFSAWFVIQIIFGIIQFFTLSIIHHPFYTIILLLSIYYVHRTVKRLTRFNVISWLLYTALPVSISLLGLIFPQIYFLTAVGDAVLHPVLFYERIREKVRKGAEPVRRTVQTIIPPQYQEQRDPPKTYNKEQSVAENHNLCKKCVFRERGVLFRPCNHFIYCRLCSELSSNTCLDCDRIVEEKIPVVF